MFVALFVLVPCAIRALLTSPPAWVAVSRPLGFDNASETSETSDVGASCAIRALPASSPARVYTHSVRHSSAPTGAFGGSSKSWLLPGWIRPGAFGD